MPASTLTRRLFWTSEVLLLAATAGAAIWLFRSEEWQPAALVVLLLVFALLSVRFSVELSDGEISPSTVAIVMAMGLLGPGPAACCGIAAMMLASATRRVPLGRWINNVTAFAAVPFAGGLLVRAAAEALNVYRDHHLAQSAILGMILLGVFVLTLAVNFVLVGLNVVVEEGQSLARQLPEYLPLLPGELAAGALATLLTGLYASAGLAILVAAIAPLLIFQRLIVALVRSEKRAEQLQARSRQLVGLQLGVLRTLVRALGMRDETTGRHAAAVASYAKALAIELGCSDEERDVVRTAGLLHEIGKFTWPDRVLHAKSVSEEDMAIVKSHPQEGAILVGALDGYGPVADAILYHHERIDGRGYPAGLIGQEIPLASRILAICSAYDTMTARESYRAPMTPQEAMHELRIAAERGQLDPELVETFIAVLERDGPMFGQEAEFEIELEFERRVQQMVEPH